MLGNINFDDSSTSKYNEFSDCGMSLKERRSNVQFATAGNINTTIANVSTYFNIFNISRKAVHCRFQVPDNTQKILTEI